MTNTHIHTRHSHPPLSSSKEEMKGGGEKKEKEGRKGAGERERERENPPGGERKSVGAVERQGGRRWEYVCGCLLYFCEGADGG